MSTKTIGAFTGRLNICMIIWLLKLRETTYSTQSRRLPAVKLGNRNSSIRVPVPIAHGGPQALLPLALAAKYLLRCGRHDSQQKIRIAQGDVGSWPLAAAPSCCVRVRFGV